MCKGWVAVHRKIKDNWLWKDKPFSKGQAWIDILIASNHADNKFFIKGQLINVKRGQTARSEVTMSNEWGWSRSKVRKFLKILEKEQMIIQQKNNLTTVISVINYDELQKIEQQKDSRKTTERQQKNTNNNDNNDNNDNNKKNIKKKFGYYKNVLLNEKEYNGLIKDFGEKEAYKWIEKLSEGIAIHGYKYKNFNATIRKWKKNEVVEKPKKGKINVSSYS